MTCRLEPLNYFPEITRYVVQTQSFNGASLPLNTQAKLLPPPRPIMFTCSYRNFSASITLLQTLASSSVRTLRKHHHQKKNALFWCPVSSNTKRKFSCESLKQDVGHTTTTNSVTGYPEYNRLLPYHSDNGLPRKEHLVVSEEGPVLDYICKALDLPPQFVADLIHFGAVHYAVVSQQLLPTETPEQIGTFEEVTAPLILKKRTSIKGKTAREAQKISRITHVDQFLEAGTYLQVHINPKRFPSGPPRIEHLVVSEEGPVLDYICKALALPPLYVADLIKFGAVHYALVCPQPPPTATPEQIRVFEEVTAPSVLKKRASIKGKTVREAQKTFRITHADQFLEAGSYLRVHVHPKRFPRCYDIDWKSRIIAVAESYVVLDKPAGTSVGGTIDNIEESCANFATRALGLTTPLMTTHQIDNCTEGCLVLARTKAYCSVFHGKIREKTVRKLYLALAASPVPVGVITHYMRPVNIAPRLVSKEFIEAWHLCQLEVMECKKVPWPNAVIEEKYCVEDCGWPSKDYAYECKINLLTGRTHQIRAQLADLGAPLLGDSIYMPAAIAEMVSPGLNPFGSHKKQYSSEDDKAIAVKEWVAQHGKEPNVAIGLQACQISWDEGKHIYNAGSPWWMQNDIK